MIFNDYSLWSNWDAAEVRDYAVRLSAWFGLDPSQQKYLSEQMLFRIGVWPFQADRRLLFPVIIGPEEEAELRSIGFSDAALLRHNQQLNRPARKIARKPASQPCGWRTLGAGLTRRVIFEPRSKNADERSAERRHNKYKGEAPFRHLGASLDRLTTECFWQSNCYPFEAGEWILGEGATEPYQGLVWYALQLERAFENACAQDALKNSEAAMSHAFRAGGLCTELQILLARGKLFEKYEAVNLAQRDAARARLTVSMEARRKEYWGFRAGGHKRVEAGRLAAAALGFASESSIRQAFPNQKYPAD